MIKEAYERGVIAALQKIGGFTIGGMVKSVAKTPKAPGIPKLQAPKTQPNKATLQANSVKPPTPLKPLSPNDPAKALNYRPGVAR